MSVLDRARAALSGRFQQGVLWNFGSLGILAVSGFLMLRLIQQVYDRQSLGIFSLVWTAYIFFSQAAVGGMDRSVLRAVAEHQRERAAIGSIVLGALVPAAVQCALVTVLFYVSSGVLELYLKSPGMAEGMEVASAGLFCFGLNKVFLAVVNGLQRMRAYAVYQSIRYALMPLGVLAAFQLGLSGSRVAFLFTFSEGILFLVLLVEMLRVVPREWPDWRRWSPLHLRYGLKSMLSGMLLELNTRIDVLMLSRIRGDVHMVATYTVALQIVEGFFQILIALQSNYNPIIAKHVAEGRLVELEAVIARGKRFTYALLACIGLIAIPLFPWAVVVLMGEPGYSAGWLPFSFLIGGIVVSAGYQPFFQTLLMANRPGWHNAFMLATLLSNVIGNSLLIPRYGMEGAALATAASFVVSIFVLKAIVRRQVGVRL